MKPTLKVLLAADFKGAQIGSSVGLALAVPYAAYRGNQVTFGGAACMAGGGMIVGSTMMMLKSGVELVKCGKDEIAEKAQNFELSTVDKACIVASGIGMATGLQRVISKTAADENTLKTVLSKRGVWSLLAFGAFGVGVCYGGYVIVEGGKKLMCEVKKKIDERDGAAANGEVESAAEAAESVAKDVKDAVETAVNDATATEQDK